MCSLHENVTLAQILAMQTEVQDPKLFPLYTGFTDFTMKGWVAMKSIAYQATVKGDTGTYMTTIAFDKIEFLPIDNKNIQEADSQQDRIDKAKGIVQHAVDKETKAIPIQPVKAAPIPIKPTPNASIDDEQNRDTQPLTAPPKTLQAPAGYKEIDIKPGLKMFYKVPNINVNTVRVRCTCPQFNFTYSLGLNKFKAIVGPWHRYQRKTPYPPAGYPVRQKGHLPGHEGELVAGLCKHLNSFCVLLQHTGLLLD